MYKKTCKSERKVVYSHPKTLYTMAQIIYTKEKENYVTGEIIDKEIYRKQVANAEQFIRMYLEDIGALAKCSGAEKGVILCSMKYLDYATNEFILTPERRKDICECGDIKPDTVSSSISRLLKKNILIKKSGSTYILNPKLFFYGKDIDRAGVIKATIAYEIGGKGTNPDGNKPRVDEEVNRTIKKPFSGFSKKERDTMEKEYKAQKETV